MAVNITSIKTSSNGAWQGDNPLHYAFPLLIIQTTLILIVSRSLAFVLKPLRQPKVIAEIIGGILLGPSALGRNQEYLHNLFPKWSMPILETVASIGLLFFLFLVGLELDIASIRKSGKRAFSIAAAGITVPFVSGIGVAFILRKTVDGVSDVGLAQFIVFMGVALSITAFPVLARILAELKLLTTQVGETAMAAAAFNDVVAWVLLALAVALAGDGDGGGGKSPLISVWVLLSGVAFVAFMMIAVRPVMDWISKRCTPDSDTVDELYICLTLLGVMVSGFMTDFIGIHSIFGAFVFGLTIPKGEFAGKLMERIEDFVSGLLLPLYFASSGLKTDVTKISGGSSLGMLALVIFTACAGKILGTFIVAMLHKIPARESLTLGLLMNTKGLVELIVLNIGKEKKVLNDEIFAILVLMALFTTFMTTPSVMAVYKPARSGGSPHIHRKLQPHSPSTADSKKELRLLACVHGSSNVPALINLIESTRGGTKKSPLKLYVMHLVELTERSSSIIMVQRARRNGLPFWNRRSRNGDLDRVGVAFQAYGQLGRVQVRPMTAISALSTMHEDVCNVAEDKRVTMMILPFHRRGRNNEVMPIENMGPAWRSVNQNVLKKAQCSVAVLIDRGLGSDGQTTPGPTSTVTQAVCVLFFGGPDDREALMLGGRMAEHPGVKMTVVRFIEKNGKELNSYMLRPSPEKNADDSYSFSTAVMDRQREEELDGEAVTEFMKRWKGMADYVEKSASNIVDEVARMGRSGEYELIIVGKGRFPSTIVAGLADNTAEHPELGPIGDILGSSRHGVVSSVLVVQQHDVAHANELPVSKVTDSDTSTTLSPMYHGTSTSTTLSPV